jgi:hypothetical protein
MTTGRINQVAAFCWAGPGFTFPSKGKAGPSSLQSARRHSKLSASAVRWIPRPPLPAAGRTGMHLLSCPHCIAPCPDGLVSKLLDLSFQDHPWLPSPAAYRQEASTGWPHSAALQVSLQGRFAPLRPIHTHGVSIQVPPLCSTAKDG